MFAVTPSDITGAKALGSTNGSVNPQVPSALSAWEFTGVGVRDSGTLVTWAVAVERGAPVGVRSGPVPLPPAIAFQIQIAVMIRNSQRIQLRFFFAGALCRVRAGVGVGPCRELGGGLNGGGGGTAAA
jgi:hypothetical protein